MRPIAALDFPGIIPAAVDRNQPICVTVPPTRLLVDDSYQRNLSGRSIKLIGKIVEGWDWMAYKPPICTASDQTWGDTAEPLYEVLDGQHTAIAAATLGIPRIPVMIVSSGEIAERAAAFVKHNKDRIAVTPAQLHHALVAAGDPVSVQVEQIAASVGVKLLRTPPGSAKFNVNDCLAISTIKGLIAKRGEVVARMVLETCAEIGKAPLGQHIILAVDMLMNDPAYTDAMDSEKIVELIKASDEQLSKEAMIFAKEHGVPFWRAYAAVTYMNRPKNRKILKAKAA